MRISGRVAVVTGGARGLGKGFTEALLKRGAKVCFADINVAEGTETERYFKRQYGEQSAMFVMCDVSKETDVMGLLSTAAIKFGYISLFVNNAGILNENAPKRTIDVNLTGAMYCTQLAVDYMRKDKGGKGGLIVTVASSAAIYPTFYLPAYTASKHGILGYTRAWANNPSAQKKYGINFACICPAFSDTQMLAKAFQGPDPPLVSYKENEEEIKRGFSAVGINSLDAVVNAFMQVVETDDNNGLVITINTVQGVRQKFQESMRAGKL